MHLHTVYKVRLSYSTSRTVCDLQIVITIYRQIFGDISQKIMTVVYYLLLRNTTKSVNSEQFNGVIKFEYAR